VKVPALAAKLADTVPEATLTDGGTVSARALLESKTVTPPRFAALDRVTVQIDEPPTPRLAGAQDNWLTVVGASNETYAVSEIPFNVPVIPAVRFTGIVPAVATKLAEVIPAGTVSGVGTNNSPVELVRATLAPPAGAAWFSVAVQVVEPPVLRKDGLQESPLRYADGIVMVPPIPAAVRGPPAGVAAATLVTPTVVEDADGVITTVIAATMPSCIVLSLAPPSRQVSAPELAAQVMVLPAAVALAPGAAAIDATFPGEYVRVHCSAAGEFPP